MTSRLRRPIAVRGAAAALLAFGLVWGWAARAGDQDPVEGLAVDHADCVFFSARRAKFTQTGLEAEARRDFRLGALTAGVVRQLPALGVRLAEQDAVPAGLIDRHLFQAMADAGVQPAPKTNDFEFFRRVTLDLTGRVPTAQRVEQFVADSSPDKRAAYVEELLKSPEWVDKWTMFFGDLLQNSANLRSIGVIRYAEGRNAFYQWIKASIEANKSYRQMATELITARGQNSYEQGEMNWIAAGSVNGGPRTGQDFFDQLAVNTAETFLGVGHMNCVMCHDGRRHLETLSLWGARATRLEAYELAAFFSRTSATRQRVNAASANPYYWSVADNVQFRVDYQLNTTTGNRPPRNPVGTMRVVAPQYPFTQRGPQPGEDYRQALARELTADPQFGRAMVNYLWREFFGKGMVEPANQFDPLRLDPDNPPPAPWKLQPTHPRLLNELAAEFARNNFDLKWLMRQMVNSEAYQLSARYPGGWNPAWENLFARKFVRRLWAEEIHDAIVQTSGVPVSYNVRGIGVVNWAMRLPEPFGLPGGAVNSFLDSFLRGNRDDEDRRGDGSSLQALNLMNDTFVMSRTRATGNSLAARLLANGSEDQIVRQAFLNVLSRFPTEEERGAALAGLRSGNRQQAVEDLVWSLYNKVDFFFNY